MLAGIAAAVIKCISQVSNGDSIVHTSLFRDPLRSFFTEGVERFDPMLPETIFNEVGDNSVVVEYYVVR